MCQKNSLDSPLLEFLVAVKTSGTNSSLCDKAHQLQLDL